MPAIQEMSISGLRGFADAQVVRPAVPVAGRAGSGITTIVGPNNSGKSTILEAVAICARTQPGATISRADRGRWTGYRTEIRVVYTDSRSLAYSNGPNDLDQFQLTQALSTKEAAGYCPYFVSRDRTFPAAVNHTQFDRSTLIRNAQAWARGKSTDLSHRVRSWTNPKWKALFRELSGVELDFLIEGQRAIVIADGHEHQPVSMGAGLSELACILDALTDAPDGSIVMIDEPEASLHPVAQRRLMSLFRVESERLQIIIATHSPLFVCWTSLANGGALVRVTREHARSCRVSQLSQQTAIAVAGLARDLNNPHVLGQDATEVLFQPDGIVLVEGQEDVVCFRSVMENMSSDAQFFGWGVGGADKMALVAQLLKEVGFRRVAGILDSDRSSLRNELSEKFPRYEFYCLPTANVRDKPAQPPRDKVEGLFDRSGTLKGEHQGTVNGLLAQLERYFRQSDA